MTRLLVASTADGTGKTAIAIALAKLASERGATVSYMKPKGTSPESTVGKTRDQDPALAREVLDLDAEMHELEPVVYSPTLVREAIRGREKPTQLRERITDAVDEVAADADVTIFEGGDRLATGGIVELTDPEVAALLDAEVVLVSHYSEPRDVDSILEAAGAVGDRLAGVLYNDVSAPAIEELTDDVMPFLDGRGIDSLGTVPHDESIGITVGELADSLGAELLTGGVDTDRRIERFRVGATSANTALTAFRRTRSAAVITGGDRPEMQTAALEASGVVCLVLTGGYRPSNAVLGRASDEAVPVLLVEGETRTTIDRTERLLRSGRTQHPETVERMATVLERNVDIGTLLDMS
ncbi:MAG: BioD-like N-terminal domain of phosphotransacetylase [halophilic archaeon J07HX64]|jgi:BioD-like N-terminal domain of phosphotransacetylase|nr:MAG: BioD-like N-terminal domain of phosphotransacetylase [halophilic archaeon J07HX64]